MKKAISLILVLIMLVGVFSGCTTLEKTSSGDYDKGAVIQMHLTTETYNFDPQQSITDEAMLKVMSLIYEGLTKLGDNGKWEKALMKKYKIEKDTPDCFSILIYLKNTRWTDARTVQASDFTYAWKRILDPDNKNEAAALLYDIKNAYDIKMGDATIDDLGATAVDTYTIRIEFEHKIDLDSFFTKLSSIALVPLREDVISQYGEEHWSAKTTSIVCNGPFVPKGIEYGSLLRLDRNAYYMTNPEKTEVPDKYVIPYKLITDYSIGDSAAVQNAFDEGVIFYNDDIPLSLRNDLAKKATVTDMMATHTYMFNLANPLFADANVRKALSIAIDRQAIADLVVFAKPATGFIPYKVFDTKSSTQFRKVGGDVLSTSPAIDEAKSLLNAAGVNGGYFTITVRDTEVDVAIAEAVKASWEALGFNVTINALSTSKYSADANIVIDDFQQAYDEGIFDVIAYDMTMLSPYAFQTLAQFADTFSGNGVDMRSENYDVYTHISGYNSEEYNALIAEIYNETDASKQASLLHDAEKLLLNDGPVAPVIFLQDAYVVNSKVLSGIDTDYYGTRIFSGMKQKNYMSYKVEVEEE